MKHKLVAYTDGGCIPNPGNGAWGFVVLNEKKIVIDSQSGFEKNTTNNRMEYTAVLKVMEKYKDILICSDSKLLVNTVNTWMHSWCHKGWRKKGGEIKNLDLVMSLFKTYNKNHHELIWVKGHSGILGNELADELCTKTISENTGISLQELKGFERSYV